jgi:hypothetical protein
LSEQEASDKEEEEDIFSFFSSHENIVLKPESSFKGLRGFLKTLPIDYYILLQDGYEKKKPNSFKHTNYIMFRDFPLL